MGGGELRFLQAHASYLIENLYLFRLSLFAQDHKSEDCMIYAQLWRCALFESSSLNSMPDWLTNEVADQNNTPCHSVIEF